MIFFHSVFLIELIKHHSKIQYSELEFAIPFWNNWVGFRDSSFVGHESFARIGEAMTRKGEIPPASNTRA
ncbi:hypothetical protein [Flavobacterium sp.]|uniref:hypothetical protein n=1 Tax=Flavobacterium sp. TaxID=239 RepID=UPI0037BEE286